MAIDTEKTEKLIKDLLQVCREHDPTVTEAILAYGSLGYYLGSSMASIDTIKYHIDVETLKKEYYLNPTVDIALMIQGLLITSWAEDYKQRPVLSELYKKLEEDKGEKE